MDLAEILCADSTHLDTQIGTRITFTAPSKLKLLSIKEHPILSKLSP